MPGPRYITQNELETALRKFRLSISGAGITTLPPSVEGVESFIDLDDVENDYSGHAGSIVNVNAAVDGLEFSPYVTLSSTAPIVTIGNATDDPVDPILQFATGATPVVKYTMGVDDSDGNKWKLAVGDEFGDDHDTIVVTSGEGLTPVVSEFTLDHTYDVSGVPDAPWGVCSYGAYVYYVHSTGGDGKIGRAHV